MTNGVRTTTATMNDAVYHTALPRISESMFITTCMDGHDEEKRWEQNLMARSRKSEAELALDVLYYWMTDTEHRKYDGHTQTHTGKFTFCPCIALDRQKCEVIFAPQNLISNWLTYLAHAKLTGELISFGF